MTSRDIAALRAAHPMSDIDALLGMEDEELARTRAACLVIYGSGSAYKNIEQASPRVPNRERAVREILELRVNFMDMTDGQRAAIVMRDGGGAA